MGYLRLCQAISGYHGQFWAISSYLRLHLDIMSYITYLWLSLAIFGFLWLSKVISNKYQVSGCNSKQERTIYCYFKSFWLFIFFFLARASSRGARDPKIYREYRKETDYRKNKGYEEKWVCGEMENIEKGTVISL